MFCRISEGKIEEFRQKAKLGLGLRDEFFIANRQQTRAQVQRDNWRPFSEAGQTTTRDGAQERFETKAALMLVDARPPTNPVSFLRQPMLQVAQVRT